MAISNLTSTLAVYASEFKSVDGGVADQINRSVTLMRLIPWKPAVQADIAWTAKLGGATAQKNSEGGALTAGAPNEVVTARLERAIYESSFGLTDIAAMKAEKSSSPTAVKDAWLDQLGDHLVQLSKTVEAKLFTGDGTANEYAGLDLAIDDTAPYAGIDPAVKTAWKSYVNDGGAALSRSSVRQDLDAVAKLGGRGAPDLAVCSLETLEKVRVAFDSQTFYIYDVTMPSVGKVNLEGGGGVVNFGGTRFVGCVDAPADTIYYLNTSKMFIDYNLPGDFSRLMSQINASMMARGVAATGDAFGPMKAYLRDIPAAAMASQAAVITNSQLVLTQRSAFGVRKNIP